MNHHKWITQPCFCHSVSFPQKLALPTESVRTWSFWDIKRATALGQAHLVLWFLIPRCHFEVWACELGHSAAFGSPLEHGNTAGVHVLHGFGGL